MERITGIEGYSAETPVLLVGAPPYTETTPQIGELSAMTGVKANIPGMHTYGLFLNRYLGLPNPIEQAAPDALSDQNLADSVRAMPVYPEVGAVRTIGDTLVVRFE